jgi:hypothetical protein
MGCTGFAVVRVVIIQAGSSEEAVRINASGAAAALQDVQFSN